MEPFDSFSRGTSYSNGQKHHCPVLTCSYARKIADIYRCVCVCNTICSLNKKQIRVKADTS